MPAPFRPVPLPFVSGVRRDLGDLANESPSQLREAENVVFTRTGHLSGRPGQVSRDGQVQLTGGGGALVANLATAVQFLAPAGVVSAPYGTATDAETALALWQGQGVFYRDGIWATAGVHWSVRATTSAALSIFKTGGSSRQNPIPVGRHVVGVNTTLGQTSGFAILNDGGEVPYVSTGSTVNYDAVSRANSAAAGDALFYLTAAGNVEIQFPGNLPVHTSSVIGTGGDTSTLPRQNICAVDDQQGMGYFVAYKSATAGRISLIHLDSTGAVMSTLNVNGLGTVLGVTCTFDPDTGYLGLAWIDSAVPSVKTKMFSVIPTLADLGSNLTLTGTPETSVNFFGLHSGYTHTLAFSVVFTLSSGSAYIGGREFGSATETSIMTMAGVYTGFGTGLLWEPLFGGVILSNRTVVGLVRSTDTLIHRGQWVVLDVSRLYASGITTDRVVVASGPSEGMDRVSPGSITSLQSSAMVFAVPEGISFNLDATLRTYVDTTATRRIMLTTQPSAAVHAHGNTLLTGQCLRVFDGTQLRPHHFVEEAPFILATSAIGGAGSLSAGSYSYQSTWEAYNARGQRLRSGASNILTLTSAGGQSSTVVSTIPQLWSYVTEIDYVRVRLWASVKNATATADKFLVTETVVSATPTGPSVSQIHVNEATGAEEKMYEGATILADMHAPGADRGVAFANERAWVADQRRVYASKLLRNGVAPSWNSEGGHTLEVPTAIGTIQGIAGMGDRLVVVCSSGVAVVTGSGLDDSGAGIGWVVDVVSPNGSGEISPRSVVSTPEGVAFQGRDGDVWLVLPDFRVVPISRPVRGPTTAGPNDLAWISSTRTAEGSTNPLLMAGTNSWRVLDTEAAQWGTWTFDVGPSYVASVNGAAWGQLTASPWVVSVDGPPGLDLGTPNAARVVTGSLAPSGSAGGWGRVRGFSPMAKSSVTPVAVTALMLADADERTMMNKTQSYSTNGTGRWPDGRPEFRTSMQRCSFARLDVTIEPAAFEWAGIHLWVSNTGEASPSRTRS